MRLLGNAPPDNSTTNEAQLNLCGVNNFETQLKG